MVGKSGRTRPLHLTRPCMTVCRGITFLAAGPASGRKRYPVGNSNELDPVAYLFRLENFPDQFQRTQDFADRSALLMAVGDPRVRYALVVQAQKVRVVGNNHAVLSGS